ncbi:MAG: universal stress protein [Balneolaceae bacterium]|nr:MAG: universal stress protein [Balneolaceae bacterium]
MNTLFTHALVALDLSEASDLIVKTVPHFKEFGTRKITLVTVVSVPFTGERTEFNIDDHKQKLDQYKKELEQYDLIVETEVRAGTYFYAPAEILTAAAERAADFLIIGSRGQSKVQELLIGSTATEVLQRSLLPVFLINIDMKQDSEESEKRSLYVTQPVEDALNHVLHATDFSDTAKRAFNVVRNLDEKGNVGKISLIHVQGDHAIALKDPASLERLNEQTLEQLEELRNELSDKTRNDSEIIITYGTPGREIIQAIDQNGVTLVVMGSQGRGFVEEFFLGGVSTQVTRYSKVPVLLIPAEREG